MANLFPLVINNGQVEQVQSTDNIEAHDIILDSLTGGNVTTSTDTVSSILQLDASLTDANANTGFVSWGGSGNYWSMAGANFTLLRPGVGFVNGKYIAWTAPQTIAIPANTTPVIGIDNTGTIQIGNEDDLTSYTNQIPLFLALYDGSQTTVSMESHFYGAPPRVYHFLHQTLGIIVTGAGANVTRVTTGTGSVATDRELSIVGADVVYDLYLSTTIPDSGGVGVQWDIYYTDVSGHWIRYAQDTAFPMVYNNAGTVSSLTTSGNGHFGVFNLYVTKQSLNTSTPVYVAVMDNARFNSSGAAATAIANGTIAFATNELQSLQMAHLGYIIVTNNVSGGFISTVTIAKSTYNAVASGSGAANTASLVSVDTSTFVNFFTVADTTVQNALDTLDGGIVSTDTASTIVKRDASGNFSAGTITASITGHASLDVPYTGANTTVDLNNQALIDIAHLGIGQSTIPDSLIRAIGDNTTLSRISMRGYSNDAFGSSVRVTKFRGTIGTPLVPNSGDSLGQFQFCGYSTFVADGILSSYIEAKTTENWTASHTGSQLYFYVTPTGTNSVALVLTLAQDQSATFTNSVTATNFIGPLTGNVTGNCSGYSEDVVIPVKEENTSNIVIGQVCYISGSSGTNIKVGLGNCTVSPKFRVIGLAYANILQNQPGFVMHTGTLMGVDTRTSNTAVNPNGETWNPGDFLYLASTNGGMTNVRPTSGRICKIGYSVKGNSNTDEIIIDIELNPVWLTASSAEDIVLRQGDSIGANKISIRNYTNTEVASINSNGLITGTTTTQSQGDNSTKLASTAYVDVEALKRSANDFNTFPLKSTPVGTDLILIEDGVTGAKKYVTVSSLIGTGPIVSQYIPTYISNGTLVKIPFNPGGKVKAYLSNGTESDIALGSDNMIPAYLSNGTESDISLTS